MADADRLVAALRYQQEMEEANRAAYGNPSIMRQGSRRQGEMSPITPDVTPAWYERALPMEGRATFLPFRDTASGGALNKRELALPGLLAGALNAMTAPGRALSGSDPTFNPEEEAANVAGMVMSGGAGASLLAPIPVGSVGMVPSKVAARLNTARTLPTDPLFKQAVENTPGALITDAGLSMRLQRNQLPEQALQESVRGGVFYLPEGSANARHYGTGKSGYGGKERITGETQINNPLFVKGATGGKAPEAAYDSLIGKGAYQKMREDALRVRHPDLIKERGNSLPGAITPEAFLSKYAPDLEGMGEQIFLNSRKGNQFAYALQEAAVASAARKAGHDAVMGYSVGRGANKGKPTISEVFDVREKNYPDKFGTATDIWEGFKGK